MPATGYRNYTTGALINVGDHIGYWSSSTHASDSHNASWLRYWQGALGPLYGSNRAHGFSVRCVQHLRNSFFRGEKFLGEWIPMRPFDKLQGHREEGQDSTRRSERTLRPRRLAARSFRARKSRPTPPRFRSGWRRPRGRRCSCSRSFRGCWRGACRRCAWK